MQLRYRGPPWVCRAARSADAQKLVSELDFFEAASCASAQPCCCKQATKCASTDLRHILRQARTASCQTLKSISMQSYAYGASAPVLPQDQGFRPLAAAASGAPPPILMPGQPYGYANGMPVQSPYTNTPYQPQQQYQQCPPAYPMQQQVYPMQQQYQQYQQYPGPQQFAQYTAPQQFQQYPQAPGPMYGGLPPPSSGFQYPPPASGFQYPNSGYSQGAHAFSL